MQPPQRPYLFVRIAGHRLPPKFAMLSLSVLFILLLRRAETVAPGDEDSSCNSPSYPVTIKVLMDSWRYRNLLPENDGVWTTYYDPDTSHGTLWRASGPVICGNGSVSVCSGDEGESVLETQIINKSLPAPDTYTVRVFINITYNTDCNRNQCGNDTLLTIQDTSNMTVVDVMPENSLKKQNISSEKKFYFDVEPNEMEQFQVKLVSPSNSACIRISRILIYRHECPGHEKQSTGLPRHPAVQAPVNGTLHVNTSCTENAHHAENSRPELLICTSTGHWNNDQVVCICNDGFYRVGAICKAIVYSINDRYINVTEDQGSVTVCFKSRIANSGHVNILTSSSSAISNFDYISSENTTSFPDVRTDQCINIRIIRDELTEDNESFLVHVINGSSVVSTTTVTILSNAGNTPCQENNITLSRGLDNSSLQLVEMCDSNEGVWSPLCDNGWTRNDAIVVCKTLGYTSVANWTTLHTNAQSNTNISCSGRENSLTNCPRSRASFAQPCTYLLLECTDGSPVVANPTGIEGLQPSKSTIELPPSLAGGPVVSPDGSGLLAGSPVVSPDGNGKPPGSSPTEDKSSLVILAVPIAVISTAILAVVTILTILIIVIVKKQKLKQNEKRQNGHLTNPVYDAASNGTIGKTTSSNSGDKHGTDREQGEEEGNEESTTLHNPLYSSPNGLQQQTSNGNGATHIPPQYDDPQYSVPEIPRRETPTVMSLTSSTSSPKGPSPTSPPPPPPHTYDYAAVPRLVADPEYAPLENVRARHSHGSDLGSDPAVPSPPPVAAYHTLEPPDNTVTYHVLESPASPQVDSRAFDSTSPDSLAEQRGGAGVGGAGVGRGGQGGRGGGGGDGSKLNNEYSTLEHDDLNTEVFCHL